MTQDNGLGKIAILPGNNVKNIRYLSQIFPKLVNLVIFG
jgi:hypothetical protein